MELFVSTVTVIAAVFLHKKYIKIVDNDFMQKCDSCNFNSDEEKVKKHCIMKRRFTLCQLRQNH